MKQEVKRGGSRTGRGREAPGRPALAAAARRLFADRGYTSTTIQAIAEEAGYAVQTVYFHFGSKATIAHYLFEQMKAEDILPLYERSLREADPLERLAITARIARQAGERWWDIYTLLRYAGRADPELSGLSRQLDDERLYGVRTLAQALAGAGHLREGVDVQRATDILWTIAAEDTYQRLVVERGWSPDDYEAWLTRCLQRELIG